MKIFYLGVYKIQEKVLWNIKRKKSYEKDALMNETQAIFYYEILCEYFFNTRRKNIKKEVMSVFFIVYPSSIYLSVSV